MPVHGHGTGKDIIKPIKKPKKKKKTSKGK